MSILLTILAFVVIESVLLTLIIKYKKWLYDRCPGREKCCFDWCVKDSIYGCPVSPNGTFLSEEERRELKKKIAELD